MYQVSYNVRMPDGSLRSDASHFFDTIVEARKVADSLTRQFNNVQDLRLVQKGGEIRGVNVSEVWFDEVELEQIIYPMPAPKQTITDKYKDGGSF